MPCMVASLVRGHLCDSHSCHFAHTHHNLCSSLRAMEWLECSMHITCFHLVVTPLVCIHQEWWVFEHQVCVVQQSICVSRRQCWFCLKPFITTMDDVACSCGMVLTATDGAPWLTVPHWHDHTSMAVSTAHWSRTLLIPEEWLCGLVHSIQQKTGLVHSRSKRWMRLVSMALPSSTNASHAKHHILQVPVINRVVCLCPVQHHDDAISVGINQAVDQHNVVPDVSARNESTVKPNTVWSLSLSTTMQPCGSACCGVH